MGVGGHFQVLKVLEGTGTFQGFVWSVGFLSSILMCPHPNLYPHPSYPSSDSVFQVQRFLCTSYAEYLVLARASLVDARLTRRIFRTQNERHKSKQRVITYDFKHTCIHYEMADSNSTTCVSQSALQPSNTNKIRI